MTVNGYGLFFDWSRSGGYGGTLEDVSSYVDDQDLQLTVGRDTSQAAASLQSGTLAFNLREKASVGSEVFVPESATSPIGGKILPGVPATFQVTIAGATTTLFTGPLDDFTYSVSDRSLSGIVQDSWGAPGQQRLSTPVYQGLSTGALIGIVLDAIGWSATARDLDAGATVVAWWWEEGTDAATAVQKLVDSEGPPAIAYIDGGTFVFRDRHHRISDANSLTSQGTFTHIYPQGTGPGGDFKMQLDSITYNHGLRQIINTATFAVDQRIPGDVAVVWDADQPLTILSGATLLITATPSDPFIQAITPTIATAVDDAGNPNGDVVLVSGSLSGVTIGQTSGQATLITLTASSDTVISRIQLRAVPLPVARTVTVTAADVSSQLDKGIQTWPGSLPWCNEYDAQAIATRIVNTYAVARPVITFTIDGGVSAAYLAQFAARKISDRITIREDILDLNGDYFIERITRTVRGLGRAGHLLTITAEAMPPLGATNPFTFDLVGSGFDQGQFQVTGLDAATTVFRFDTAGQGFDAGMFAT